MGQFHCALGRRKLRLWFRLRSRYHHPLAPGLCYGSLLYQLLVGVPFLQGPFEQLLVLLLLLDGFFVDAREEAADDVHELVCNASAQEFHDVSVVVGGIVHAKLPQESTHANGEENGIVHLKLAHAEDDVLPDSPEICQVSLFVKYWARILAFQNRGIVRSVVAFIRELWLASGLLQTVVGKLRGSLIFANIRRGSVDTPEPSLETLHTTGIDFPSLCTASRNRIKERIEIRARWHRDAVKLAQQIHAGTSECVRLDWIDCFISVIIACFAMMTGPRLRRLSWQ
mmetsp:Transcript_5465/g.15659  ORF Transcript_5465/g.15659 Transcript_5465/m.15659 type:complete len:284 (+) Transcript_5465:824-1675(+)